MFRVVTKIVIQQVTQIQGKPGRNKTLTFDFVTEMKCSDSWRDLTNQGEIIIPRNLYVRDKNNKLVSIVQNIGGFSDNPLLMRGDKVTMDYGYRYFKKGIEIFEGTNNQTTGSHLFDGWISQVSSKMPIKFKVEDNFWKLKQTACPIHTFKNTDTLEGIINYLLSVYNKDKYPDEQFTFRPLTTTTFGDFRVGNETIAEVMGRLQKTFHFESYFKGNELRCGINPYIESEAKTNTFTFQKDIISDDLEYRRKEDLVLSMIASTKNEEATGKTTKDGNAKTKCVRLEVLVTFRNGSDIPTTFIKKKGEDYPPNTGGERANFTFSSAKNIKELTDLATTELRLVYYTGFKGKFTTFGLPFVKMGDHVKLIDPILPERNGKYKVKSVEYSAGVSGVRQIIELHYRIL
jgi:hypothetical protein